MLRRKIGNKGGTIVRKQKNSIKGGTIFSPKIRLKGYAIISFNLRKQKNIQNRTTFAITPNIPRKSKKSIVLRMKNGGDKLPNLRALSPIPMAHLNGFNSPQAEMTMFNRAFSPIAESRVKSPINMKMKLTPMQINAKISGNSYYDKVESKKFMNKVGRTQRKKFRTASKQILKIIELSKFSS